MYPLSAKTPNSDPTLYPQVYEPADKLGLYGLNPLLDPSKRTYIATGDSGQGMTGAAIAAMVLTDAILDRPSPYRDVRSRFSTQPLYLITSAAPPALHRNVNLRNAN